MTNLLSGKIQAQKLQNFWDSLVKTESLDPEIIYRIEKLIHRMAPLENMIFLKTVKAHQLIAECSERTTELHQHIKSDGDKPFLLLTKLEKTFEDLLRKTYEFRIKAG